MFVERMRLDGKTVMIVGAGGGGHGTGAAIAAAEAGANVVGVDVRPAALEDVQARVTRLGRRFLGLSGDMRVKSEVQKVVDAALKEFGAIHCLANIVGGMQPGQWTTLLECPEEVFDSTLTLNLRTHFLTCQAVARSMVERKIAGSIVNVTSISSLPTAPGHASYGTAKRALNALSENMALEWSEYGIRVNLVAPGAMLVPRVASLIGIGGGGADKTLSFEEVAEEKLANDKVPLGHWGTPVDIASSILFLFSDLSSYMTGQLLAVDGGMSIKSVLTGVTGRTAADVNGVKAK